VKIYFSGSVSGGREDVGLYLQIIMQLKEHGLVLTNISVTRDWMRAASLASVM